MVGPPLVQTALPRLFHHLLLTRLQLLPSRHCPPSANKPVDPKRPQNSPLSLPYVESQLMIAKMALVRLRILVIKLETKRFK